MVYLRHYLAQCSPLILAILFTRARTLVVPSICPLFRWSSSLSLAVISCWLSHHLALCLYISLPAGRLIISRNACISCRRSSSLASCHHQLCMFFATIAAGHLITCYACISANDCCCRLLLSSRMYTKFRHLLRYHISYSCSNCCWERWRGVFF